MGVEYSTTLAGIHRGMLTVKGNFKVNNFQFANRTHNQATCTYTSLK